MREPNVVVIERLASRWTRPLRQFLHVTPRGMIEFLAVWAVFLTCEPTLESLLVGGAISVAGELLRLTAAGYGYNIGETSWRGPYRFVRHPYFLGSALLFFGLGVAGRHALVMGTLMVVLTLTYGLSYRRDERGLAHRFGPRYARYRAVVPAFIPALLFQSPEAAAGEPWGEIGNHKFSLEYAVLRGRHRELDAIIGLLIAYGLLYVCYRLTRRDYFHLVMAVTVGLYLLGRFVYYGVARRSKRVLARGLN